MCAYEQVSKERLEMKFSKLVESVSKKPIPHHVKHLLVEVLVMDEEGEDVEVCLLHQLNCSVAHPCDRCHSLWFESRFTS